MDQYIDLSPSEINSHALSNEEGVTASNGSFCVATGNRTGRSPQDRFIVHDSTTAHTVDWGPVNQPIEGEKFERLWEKVQTYLATTKRYISHLGVGAWPDYFVPVTVVTEYAWHNLFAQNLFKQPLGPVTTANWTILCAPGFKTRPAEDGTNSDGAVILNFSRRQILICGIGYAGEIKKAMFTVMNYLQTEQQILPMHCAANIGDKQDVALFFGLSGTGKTTLSSDTTRQLIGDDEHGWSSQHVFNFEGGCYAKCIDLDPEKEPVIYQAIKKGAVMENVVLDDHKRPQFHNGSITQNTRVGYPLSHVANCYPSELAPVPKAVIFLACDLYGVLPPVARLTQAQAAYYFLSGYTAKVGGTEVGQSGVEVAFSACFGAPFFPRPAMTYVDLLLQRLQETQAQVYLVNTGWYGGYYGHGGSRYPIDVTRSIVHSILDGSLVQSPTTTLGGFGFEVPVSIKDVDNRFCDPKGLWPSENNYHEKTNQLIGQFQENAKRFSLNAYVQGASPVSLS